MKRKPYTVQEKEELLKSRAIEKVSNSSATYSKEFKVYAVKEYLKGKSPMQIFIEAGVNINILGKEQPQKSLSRWIKTYEICGEKGLLKETRGVNSCGRPKTLTTEEQLRNLQKENEILKEQVYFLKKLRGWV